ncbi:hypothetical protein Trydic_g613 [Trypoxylus dichotomus]
MSLSPVRPPCPSLSYGRIPAARRSRIVRRSNSVFDVPDILSPQPLHRIGIRSNVSNGSSIRLRLERVVAWTGWKWVSNLIRMPVTRASGSDRSLYAMIGGMMQAIDHPEGCTIGSLREEQPHRRYYTAYGDGNRHP